MGVTGLWTVLHPVARPIKLETLSQKRLAIDASIWIYQFLKAVRDKEGNALRNSHVVGFFRRICKLLFLGIKPVFVFDGGAPALKRQTINARKRRREGRREDAVRTAGKLLAVQMQRRAEEEEKRRKEELERGSATVEEAVPENIVYAEEVSLASNQIQQTRKFRKKDQYHLPNLDVSLADMGQPNDPRIMSLEELENYARQFDAGEDINVYDFSKIDFDGPFFMSLPAGDRYNILNAARLRSRLRMGHSKEQLDAMFPDRMAFSKFQIERVAERNELTQRLMNINGMNDGVGFGQSRISSEKGREYVLVKNDGVEGGWALGVVSGNKDVGKQEKPIDIDELDRRRQKAEEESDEEDWEEDEFEDVPIEGLNRLPRLPPGQTNGGSERASKNAERRRALYRARRNNRPQNRRPAKARAAVEEADALFVADEDEEAETWEDVDVDPVSNGDDQEMADPEDEDLQRAIAMSLEQHSVSEGEGNSEDDEYREVFQQERVEEARPFARGKGMTIAHAANARSNKAAPKAAMVNGSEDDDEELDLQAALAESRRSKHSPKPRRKEPAPAVKSAPSESKSVPAPSHPFDGPLPFEKLDLGSSLLGKKKMKKLTEEAEGGFDKEEAAADKKKESKPLPPWFAGNIEEGISAAKAQEKEDREREQRLEEEQAEFEFSKPRLRRNETNEVIDLDDETKPMVIDLDDDEEHTISEKMTIEIDDNEADSSFEQTQIQDTIAKPPDEVPNMGDLADRIRAEPPKPLPADTQTSESAPPQHRDAHQKTTEATSGISTSHPDEDSDEPLDWEDSDGEPVTTKQSAKAAPPESDSLPVTKMPFMDASSDDEGDEFEEVEIDRVEKAKSPPKKQNGVAIKPSGGVLKKGPFADSSPEPDDEEEAFGDVIANDNRIARSPARQASHNLQDQAELDDEPENRDGGIETSHIPQTPPLTSGLVAQEIPIDDISPEEADQDASELIYSDPEDEEMFRALIAEENEHARFASELNNRSVQQNMRDYENELKQLRNQQKKDRRDADEVTQAMITECQQLLGLFGLPYITAPMEAEAQCAELVNLGLVDGIVTDDSDCFLFGGTRVYKNMFNQAKFVECYLSSDLEAEFGMTRKRLIALAQLLGSDYTEGLPGVGPVSAVELVGEFDSLEHFKTWWDQVQSGKLPKTADTSKFRTKFRKSQGTKLFLPPSFPDPRVEMAYLQPEVDSDPSAFQWGVPDLNALRSFLMATIGWGPERTDEILVPVIKDMNTRQSEGVQRNITSFFGGTVGAGAFAPRVRDAGSSRLQSALHRIGERSRRSDGAEIVEETAEPTASKKPMTKKKGVKRSKAANNAGNTDGTQESDDETPKKKARKTTKRRTKKTVAEDDE